MQSMDETQSPEGESNPSPEQVKPAPQEVEGPIPFDMQKATYKNLKSSIIDFLERQDHEYFLVGLQVAYDLDQSASEPGKLPFRVEYGDLEALAELTKYPAEPDAEKRPGSESEDELRKRSQGSAIPFDELKQFYEVTKAELQSKTAEPIRVGIAIVVKGSPVQAFLAYCDCPSQSHAMRYCCYDPDARERVCRECSSVC
jgi:hypothetical protein